MRKRRVAALTPMRLSCHQEIGIGGRVRPYGVRTSEEGR